MKIEIVIFLQKRKCIYVTLFLLGDVPTNLTVIFISYFNKWPCK